MKTNILIIGSGGREHALAWKLAQSPRIGKLYVAPGNGGTRQVAKNIPIDTNDIDGLIKFAEKNEIGSNHKLLDKSASFSFSEPWDYVALRLAQSHQAERRSREATSSANLKWWSILKVVRTHFAACGGEDLAKNSEPKS